MIKQTSTWDMPLRVWKTFKLYNGEQTKISTFTAFCLVLHIFTDTMVLLQFKDMKGDITDLIENVEAFAMYTHVLLKLWFTAFHQNKLCSILKDTKSFWKISECPEELKLNLGGLGNASRILQKLLLYGGSTTVFAINLNAIHNKSLPFGSWNMDKQQSIMHQLTIAVQVITVTIGTFFELALDSLFLAFLMEAVMQFRILCYYMRNLKYSSSSKKSQKDCADKLTSCIRHHIFMLGFLESLKEYFSFVLLVDYLTIIPLICGEMYMFLESSTILSLTKHGVTFLVLNLHLAFYCITADFLSSEAAAVADAIYDSNWYTEYDPTMRSSIRLIIHRSQQEVTFTAAGLGDISISTLVGMLKASWSACSVMRAMKSDS